MGDVERKAFGLRWDLGEEWDMLDTKRRYPLGEGGNREQAPKMTPLSMVDAPACATGVGVTCVSFVTAVAFVLLERFADLFDTFASFAIDDGARCTSWDQLDGRLAKSSLFHLPCRDRGRRPQCVQFSF